LAVGNDFRVNRLVVHLAGHHFDILAREFPLAGEVTRKEHAVADRVDAARNARRRLVDPFVRPRLEIGVAVPADAFQPVLDVASRLIGVERSDMTRGNDPLAQLQHVRALHRAPELGLADEEALQQRVRLELEIGQHPQLLDGAGGQVLRFVDDEQCPLALLADGHQESFEREQQVRLLDVFRAQPERRRNEPQCIVGIHLRADQIAGHDLFRVELVEQAPHDRCLARADVAGYDDEAFVLVQAVLEVRHRAPVLATAEVERRVGIELERFSGKSVEDFVHGPRPRSYG